MMTVPILTQKKSGNLTEFFEMDLEFGIISDQKSKKIILCEKSYKNVTGGRTFFSRPSFFLESKTKIKNQNSKTQKVKKNESPIIVLLFLQPRFG